MREFLRVIGMNIHDELVERFRSPLLRGALACDATLGTHLGPRSPSSMLTYLYRHAGGGDRLAVPGTGAAAIGDTLASAARASGVDIRTATPVARVIVENGRATGVETAAGERFDSLTIVSAADPKTTVVDLVGARHFETRFVKRIQNVRASGNAGRLLLGLNALPAGAGLADADFAQRLVVAPDEDYVERAFNPAKYGEYSPSPVCEITVPSLHDASVCPSGKQVMSVTVQYLPYSLNGGWTDEAREGCRRNILDTLEQFLPGLGAEIEHAELLLPVDIEDRFGVHGGHWHHAELSLDQFAFVRPVAGAAQYRLPLDGLFLCGAGAHPGGGVSGAPGRNAARAILERDRPKWL